MSTTETQRTFLDAQKEYSAFVRELAEGRQLGHREQDRLGQVLKELGTNSAFLNQDVLAVRTALRLQPPASPAGPVTPAAKAAAAVAELLDAKTRGKRDAALATYRETVSALAGDPNHKPAEKALKATAEAMEVLNITPEEFQADVAGLTAWLAADERFADFDAQLASRGGKADEAGKEATRLEEEAREARLKAHQLRAGAQVFATERADHLRRKGDLFRLFGAYAGPKHRGRVVGLYHDGLAKVEVYEDGTRKRQV